MGLDFKFLDGFIHHPVFVLKPTMFIAGFLGPIGAGIKIVSSPFADSIHKQYPKPSARIDSQFSRLSLGR